MQYCCTYVMAVFSLCTGPLFQIKEGKIEFFPLFESTVLEKEEDKSAKELQELKEMVMDVLQRFREEVRENIAAS